MSTTCESCGADDPVLYAVRRRYVTPESWDTPGSDRLMAEVEQWCYACCTHYPHEPAGVDSTAGSPEGGADSGADSAGDTGS